MIYKVAFTLYPVKNLARARTFYEDTLGLTPGLINNEFSWVEYDLPGGGCFAISDSIEGLEPSSTAGGSIAFEVEDLDQITRMLKEKDVIFKLDVFSTPVCRMAVIIDSEGNSVTLHQLNEKR